MNKLLLSLIAAATTLVAAAQTFESDGIWYIIQKDNTLGITLPPNGEPYSGKVTIVPEVTHDGTTYKVAPLSQSIHGFSGSQITELTLAPGFAEDIIRSIPLHDCKDLTRVNIGSYTLLESTTPPRQIKFFNTPDVIDVDIRERDGKTQMVIKKFEVYDIDGTKLTPFLKQAFHEGEDKYPDSNGIITLDGSPSEILTSYDCVPLGTGYYSALLYALNPTNDSEVHIRLQLGRYKTGDYVTIDGLRYSLREGKAYVYEPAEGATYSGDIVIPSTITAGGTQYTVTDIARDAFAGANITSIKINPECESAVYGFSDCPNLAYADLTDCQNLWANFAIFNRCPSLKLIDGPRTAGDYGNWAKDCPSLETVTIAEGSKLNWITSSCPAMYPYEIVNVTEQTVTLRVAPGVGGGVCTTDRTPLPICLNVGTPGTLVYADNSDGLFTISRNLMVRNGYFDGIITVCYDSRSNSYLNEATDRYNNNFGSITVTEKDLADFSGISIITAPADAPAEYYDLHGRRVASPSQPGLYIRRQGTRSERVLIRHSR